MSNTKDRIILRRLATEYAEIANLDIQNKSKDNWRALHGLAPNKPLFLIDQICWEELTPNSEFLQTECEDEFAKELEDLLKKTIYKWKFFPSDMVVKPYLELPKTVYNSGIGVVSAPTDDDPHAESHLYEDLLEDEEALQKLHVPTIRYEKEISEKRKEIAEEYFGDILPVKLVGDIFWEAFWDRIVFWRGASPVLYDLMDRPEYLHEIMAKVVEIEHKVIDQYEAQNLFRAEDAMCHCVETYCDELPKPGYDPNNTRAIDCWVSGAAQIFSEVSPAMHDEFEIEYVKPIYERFGLVNYGCCEPLHNKIDIIKKIKNVRAISISPWADVRKAAEQMENKYVMARKPNPAFLASSTADYDSVRADIRNTIDICKDTNTPLMMILKDITTVRGESDRITKWCEVVREEINR